MFKLKSNLSRFELLAAGLVTLTLFTTLGGLQHYQGELADQLSSAQAVGKTSKRTVQAAAFGVGTSLSNQDPVSVQSNASQKPNDTGQPTARSSAQGESMASRPVVAVQPATVLLSLSINGQAKGTVSLPAGTNQCNVLSQALTDSLISSLDMRYSSQYGTEAVYVIDGIGDPGSVWWTYTVNGHAPPYGCAYVTAHNGDSVNWQYLKN